MQTRAYLQQKPKNQNDITDVITESDSSQRKKEEKKKAVENRKKKGVSSLCH